MFSNIFTDYRSPDVRGYIQGARVMGYGVVKSDVADIWSRPVKILSHLLTEARDRLRSTQLTSRDPSAQLISPVFDGWVLVRAWDGTIGWMEKEGLEIVNDPVRPHEPLVSEEAFLTRYLGTPYLRGGTTTMGIDCSGLTQRYFYHVHGMTIPRHSTDQWKVGAAVTDAVRESSDLLHLRNRALSSDHVGVFFRDDRVLHACMDRGGVVLESTTELLERYDILGTTRLLLVS